MIDEIFLSLKGKRQSLAVAESCTGGGLANEISKLSGISEVFWGSVTVYSNLAKEHVLNIPHEIILKHGAVSEEVAIFMAQNCQRLFASSWALSTTGIAGPTGATPEKPVGLVWIGICGPHVSMAQKFIFTNTSRLLHRQKTIEEALSMLKQELDRQNG